MQCKYRDNVTSVNANAWQAFANDYLKTDLPDEALAPDDTVCLNPGEGGSDQSQLARVVLISGSVNADRHNNMLNAQNLCKPFCVSRFEKNFTRVKEIRKD